jgi:hypothetical protein
MKAVNQSIRMNPDPLKLSLHYNQLKRKGILLVAIICILGFASNMAYALYPSFLPVIVFQRLFDNSIKAYVPTVYSFLLSLTAALLLLLSALLAWLSKLNRTCPGWLLMSAVFLLLSLDEFVRFHEQIIPYFYRLIKLSDKSLTRFTVFLFIAVGLGLAGLKLVQFLARLPLRTKKVFLLSGSIYLLGAVGITNAEQILYHTNLGSHILSGILYYLLVNLEEACEMIAVILFATGVIDYIANMISKSFDFSFISQKGQHNITVYLKPE